MRHDKCPILVFDPRGFVDMTITRMAQRKRSLEGLRLGILDNSKWNANKLLRGASVALGKDVKFAAMNYYVKQSFSKDAAPELIEANRERERHRPHRHWRLRVVLLMLHPGYNCTRKTWHSFGGDHHSRICARDRVDSTGSRHA